MSNKKNIDPVAAPPKVGYPWRGGIVYHGTPEWEEMKRIKAENAAERKARRDALRGPNWVPEYPGMPPEFFPGVQPKNPTPPPELDPAVEVLALTIEEKLEALEDRIEALENK